MSRPPSGSPRHAPTRLEQRKNVLALMARSIGHAKDGTPVKSFGRAGYQPMRNDAQRELHFQIGTLEAKRELVPEWRFHKTRRWRFDLAFVREKLAIEVDGGGFVQGRHSRGLGIEKDCEKYAAAMLLGWRILRVTPKQVYSGEALIWIQELLK